MCWSLVGGSNAGRLGLPLDNTGKPAVVDVNCGGWVLTPKNLMKIKPVLEAECVTKPDSLIVIYAMDNSCIMSVSPSSAGLPDGIIAFKIGVFWNNFPLWNRTELME
jgi:hypothetical protein